MHIWVRPVSGGRRRPIFFCSEQCKTDRLAALRSDGWEETTSVLGWDVFIPMWEEND